METSRFKFAKTALSAAALAGVFMAAFGFADIRFARADDGPGAADVRVAAEAFDAGRRDYDQGRWEAAAANFEAADEAAPSARVLRMAIRARTKAKQYDRALTLAAQALSRYPDDEATRSLSEETIAEHRGSLHRIKVACEAACQLTVNQRAVPGRKRSAWTVFVAPGATTIGAVFAKKVTSTKIIKGAEGGETEISIAPPSTKPKPAPDPDPEPDPEPKGTEPNGPGSKGGDTAEPDDNDGFKTYDEKNEGKTIDDLKGDDGPGFFESPAFFVTMVVVSTTAVGVTVWSGVDTLLVPGTDEVKEKCQGLGTDCPEYQQGQDSQLRTNILIGASAGISAVTLLIGAFVTDWGGDEDDATGAATDKPSVSLAPFAPVFGSPGGAPVLAPTAGLQLEGRF